MPYDGNGQFVLLSPQYPAISGQIIFAEDWNDIEEDVAGGLTLALTRDGQAPPLANIPWGGFKITGYGTATADTDVPSFGQIRSGGIFTNAKFIGNTFEVSSSTADLSGVGMLTLPANTSIGTVSAAEILTLDGVTSNIQAQLNAKGAIAGQVWLGTQDFTGAAITVPNPVAGSSDNTAASTLFVTQVAFNTALPAQSAATRRRYVQSDGANASWQYISLNPFLHSLGVV